MANGKLNAQEHAPACSVRRGLAHFAVLGASSLAAALLVLWFFAPRFAMWLGLDYREAWFAPEVNRAVDTWKKVQDPFTGMHEDSGADVHLNAAINWRILFPVLAHYLRLPRPAFLALPPIGCLLVLGTVCHIVFRELGSRLQAFAAAAIIGTMSWFFVSTGWLAYFDSWYILALLAASFYRSYWTLFLACLLAPWVDERFVLTLPLVLVVRAVHFRWLETRDWRSLWQTSALITAVTLPYVLLRLGSMYFAVDASSRKFLATNAAFQHDPAMVAKAAWHGLRAAWLLVAIFLWYAASPSSPSLIPHPSSLIPLGVLAWLCLLGTLWLHVRVVGGDLSRTMSAMVPAALMGIILLHRHRPAAVTYVLLAVLLFNLLAPAKHVTCESELALRSLRTEFDDFRNARQRFHFVNPNYYVKRAAVLVQQNQLPAALEDCNTALRLDPNCGHAYYCRSIIYLRLGQLDAGRQDQDEALKLLPPDSPYREKVDEINRRSSER